MTHSREEKMSDDSVVVEEAKVTKTEDAEVLKSKNLKSKILNSIGIRRGALENGLQYYFIDGEDEEGNTCLACFAIKATYTDTVEKTFSRMFPVKAPWKEEAEKKAQEKENKGN